MKTRGLVDYHLHTARCGHAEGRLEEYARRAMELRLGEIGFSDHLPLLHVEDSSLSMERGELPLYVGEVRELQSAFPGLGIRLGIEADYIPETVSLLPPLLDAHPFDFVTGAIHFVDGWGFDDPRNIDGYEGLDLMAFWKRYFELLARAAESGLFDILAHPDLVKKFGFRPREDVIPVYGECLDRVAESGVVVEVSTAGLRKPVGEIYPGEDFLRMCRERDIEVTLGSDAHRPHEVGYAFEEALPLLRRAGYGRITLFEGRERSYMRLPS